MKKVVDYFVDNSIIVNLLTILIVVMGGMSILALNKETFPAVDFNFINIRIVYQGAAAEDVEKLVTIEVEKKLKAVDGIEEMNALSAEGAAIINLKIDPEFETDDVLIDVRNALGDLAASVPSDAETPVINKITNKNRSLLQAAVYGKNEDELRIIVKEVQDVLEQNKAITEVALSGFRDEIFDVQVDYKKMEQFEVTLNQLISAVSSRPTNITAGTVKLENREKLIRTLVEKETVSDLEKIIIYSNDSGYGVQLRDVAKVYRVYRDLALEERIDGKQAIILKIKAKTSADVLDTAAFVKGALKDLSSKLGFEYKTFNDLSYYVKRRLGILSQNGIQGILLVTICLAFFMNIRVSIITALGAPFAFLVAFALMDSFGITINLISMFALILVLGMLVDDSIIVAEQHYQYLEKGMEPKAAAKRAAMDTIAPVTSTVITTMIAFGSLFFMEGIMGKFLWAVPAVVIICLLASWLECFLILPGHLADWGGTFKQEKPKRWYKWLENVYKRVLAWATKRAGTTFLIFFVLFLASSFIGSKMRFELFPAEDVTLAYINIKGPVGAPFQKTQETLTRIEKVLEKEITKDEMVGYRTTVGSQIAGGGSSVRIGSHYGNIFIELTMQDFRKRKTEAMLNTLVEKVREVSGDYDFVLEKLKGGPPSGKGVNVEISSDSLEDLKAASLAIQKIFSEMPEFTSSEIDYENGKDQIIVKIDEVQARRLNVRNKDIALELRAAFEGITATTIKKGEDEIDVIVRLPLKERSSLKVLEDIKVLNSTGRRIPLDQMVKFISQEGAFVIRRYERKRTFSISGDVNREKSTSMAVNKMIKPLVGETISKYPGMTYQLSGENKDTQDSLRSFKKALIGSCLLIFIILIVQFGSMGHALIVMSAIPFAFIGVILSFLIFDLSIGFMALMGVLGLVGVVINDSIVLVSFINRYVEENGKTRDSILEACRSRFRPVILTTFTTVVGLLPVAHMPGGDPFLKPMAVSFAYGLLFSSTITLLFVPSCYFLYIKFMEKLGKEEGLVEG